MAGQGTYEFTERFEERATVACKAAMVRANAALEEGDYRLAQGCFEAAARWAQRLAEYREEVKQR